MLKSGSHPSGEGRRQGTLGSGDTHTGGKVTSSFWGILLYLVGLSPNGVGTPELGMRSEPANRLRVMKESQLPAEELE